MAHPERVFEREDQLHIRENEWVKTSTIHMKGGMKKADAKEKTSKCIH